MPRVPVVPALSAERRDPDEFLQRSRIVIHLNRQRIWRTFELYAGSRELIQASRELQEELTERRLAYMGSTEPLHLAPLPNHPIKRVEVRPQPPHPSALR